MTEKNRKNLKRASARHGVVILIDPPSYHYYDNLFFDLETPLNRDNTLKPNFELKQTLEENGYPVFTADLYVEIKNSYKNCVFHYWSLGAPARRALNFNGKRLEKKAAILLEPPLIKPDDYINIGSLADVFDKVFLHNTFGDGYKLPPQKVAQKLHKFYWTNRDYPALQEPKKETERLPNVVLIAGAHFKKAKCFNGYGKRLSAIKEFSIKGKLDLYGFGWNRIHLRSPFSSLYWFLKFFKAGIKVAQPSFKSEIYRRYDFSLCFENMSMSGYITEKIFDSFFSGCIPIYWGAPDIKDYIPKDTFIALNDFENLESCLNYCFRLTSKEKEDYRLAIDRFLESESFQKFQNGIHGFLCDFYQTDSKVY